MTPLRVGLPLQPSPRPTHPPALSRTHLVLPGSPVFQMCGGVDRTEEVGTLCGEMRKRPQGPGQVSREESCEPWATQTVVDKEKLRASLCSMGCTEHLLCSWPWCRKSLQLGL